MPRVLHIGVGNFFRAHQAVYTQGAGGWSITGVSLRSPAIRDDLAAQGFDYALAIRDAEGERLERITVLDDILVAPEAPEAVLTALADPEVAVVTITVTEKGYCLGPNGALDPEAVAADLADGPQTLIGYLARGLARRDTPVTVVSCDNLSGNGRALSRAVRAFADLADLTLDFDAVTFPDTMVDRITPRAPADLSEYVAQVGLPAGAPVVTEGFTEWVIEDRFAGPRPAWEDAGATIVADVARFEARKLRLLNGAHSFLAYAGRNRGYDFVHEAVADPDLRRVCSAVMACAATTLRGFAQEEVVGYAVALLARFDNPALRHSLAQIAMDGSQKMPVRIAPVLSELHAQGGETGPHARALAEWCRFVVRETGAGRALDDPLAEALTQAANAEDPVAALCCAIGLDLTDEVLALVRAA